jgi:hypothetical protein
MKFKDLLSGFIRLHILHHAAEHEIYGQWIIDELAQHGYRVSLADESTSPPISTLGYATPSRKQTGSP